MATSVTPASHSGPWASGSSTGRHRSGPAPPPPPLASQARQPSPTSSAAFCHAAASCDRPGHLHPAPPRGPTSGCCWVHDPAGTTARCTPAGACATPPAPAAPDDVASRRRTSGRCFTRPTTPHRGQPRRGSIVATRTTSSPSSSSTSALRLDNKHAGRATSRVRGPYDKVTPRSKTKSPFDASMSLLRVASADLASFDEDYLLVSGQQGCIHGSGHGDDQNSEHRGSSGG